ncbi:MAG: hypothetical protein SPE59_01685 [Treponema sp.]|nr:hypothetical protein [Treponema sp.]
MKKLTKALMAGAALLAVTSFVGCSFVKDLSNSKYEAANTVEDVYPDLEEKVETPITDEASLKSALSKSVSDVMPSLAGFSGLNYKKASTGTDAVKEVKDFATAFSDAVAKVANGESKTIDFDKTVDIEDIKFEDLLELGVSIYNDALESEGEDVITLEALYAVLDDYLGKGNSAKVVAEINDLVTLEKFLFALDLDANSEASKASQVAYSVDGTLTTALTIGDVVRIVSNIVNLVSPVKIEVVSPVKALTFFVDENAAAKIMGDENQKLNAAKKSNKFYAPVLKGFKAQFTASAAVALLTSDGQGGYISAEITAKVSQKQADEIAALYAKYKNGEISYSDYETSKTAYYDEIFSITLKSKCKKTYKIGTYNYTQLKSTYGTSVAGLVAMGEMFDELF